MKWVYRSKPIKEWETFFAILPKPIGRLPLKEGQEVVWLQWMERKWIESRGGSSTYEYRLKGD